MELLEVYKWYLDDQDILNEMVAFFSEEADLTEEQVDILFQEVSEDMLDSSQFALMLQENYGDTLCLEVFMDLLEQSTQAQLIRKRRIEQERKDLGQQFRAQKGDTEAQRLGKSVLSLATFKIDQQGRFVQRDHQGDPIKIRRDLEAKRSRSKSAKGKADAAKATEKRKQQARAGSKVGSAKFVSNLKLAS